MMIIQYKAKPPLVQGVDVTSIGNQAGEIAAMINAETFNVNVGAGSATFTLATKTVTVKNGQVVTLQGGDVIVYEQAAFLEQFEPYGTL